MDDNDVEIITTASNIKNAAPNIKDAASNIKNAASVVKSASKQQVMDISSGRKKRLVDGRVHVVDPIIKWSSSELVRNGQIRELIQPLITCQVNCFPYSYRSSNYCESNSCRSYSLLKAIAKRKGKIIAPSRS